MIIILILMKIIIIIDYISFLNIFIHGVQAVSEALLHKFMGASFQAYA